MDILPSMVVNKPQFENSSAIHRWNMFKEDFLQKENYYRNHFNLPDDTIEFFEDMFEIDMSLA